ncbi:MAG: T9SS type A sorting domain-containing protein [Bacteroidales bacterium]|nr:T9SS type A sorting domain-containing protein [Bacteroidales bacterium]
MRKLHRFFAVMLLSLVGLPIFAQTMVEIGTGTLGTATGTNYWPFGNYWENNKTQTLYLASELNTGGAATITKIAHNFERIATANNALTNFTVNFKTTSLTNLVAGAYTDMTGSVNVFSAPSFIPATATGWNEIDITDFAYDGTSNLIIEIVWGDLGGYTSTYYRNYKTAAGATDVRTLYGYADSETPPAYDASSNAYSNLRIWYNAASAAPVTVTIGTGTTSCSYPYYTLYEDARTQILVTKAEIEAAGGFAGEIANLELDVISANALTMNGFEIRAQNYAGSTLTGFVNTGWTTVYSGTDVATVGWHNKDFQIPFVWDGSSNLLFQICFDNATWSGNSPVRGSSAPNMTWHIHDDGAAGCSMTGGTAQATRPNLRFDITPLSGSMLEGIVTNAATGLPVIGAKVMVGDSMTYTLLDGSYELACTGSDVIVEVSKIGFDDNNVPFTLTPGANTLDIALSENTAAPGAVLAALNTGSTAVNLTWGKPMSGYMITYDDGVYENLVSWATAGNINAVKFVPIAQYPVTITGGWVNIGDGTYPVGNVLTDFEMAVYDDDGTLGYPNTELGRVTVTPDNYGWVHYEFPAGITISSGNFYIGMIQGGNYPNCAPIGVDETNPSMVSYSKYATANGPWVPAGYNDFMIRAEVYGSGGPLDLATSTSSTMMEKVRVHPASKSLHAARQAGGQQGEALYIPMEDDNTDAPDALLGYQVWRLQQGQEGDEALWVSLSTPTATSYVDNGWPALASGAYRWAVKAKYTGDRWSEPTFSNVLGKDWVSNVTFNITLTSVAAQPSGVSITLVNTLVNDTVYSGLTPASGTVVFPAVWKGNYDLTIMKFGYTTITENINITNNSHVFNYLLEEVQWAPYNLYVDDRTLVAVWNAPNPMVALFEEHFTTSSYATNGWTVNGGNWGIGAGNPTPGAVFNWSPQVTNYEQTITTPDIVGAGSPGLLLKYDIYLSNFGTTNENQMAVELWDGATWNRLKNYTNLNGDIPWTSETLNITAYTWDTFKIRFNAYGTDTYDINNWNIDNVVVAATLGDKSLLGYDVYLDDIQIAYTTDTTYLLPASVCIYGRTYTAAVDAVYESGTSDRDYYTFTAHFLPPPVDLTATQLQDAAYLDWEGAEWPGKKVWIDNSSSSNFAIANEVDVNAAAHTPGATDAVFDLQFNYDAAAVSGAAGNAGAESDGNFLYTTRWGSNLIHKYNLDGTLVEEFSIPGVTGLRDLAYDGQYFYGGAAATTIFQMDFTTKTLVSTITSPTAVRAIAFDDAQDGFWVNNWATNLTLVSMTGATLNTLPTAPPSMYGAAYDSWTSGGPFLWVFSGTTGGAGCQVEQISLATGTLTGVMHSVSGDLGATIAGGLFTQGGIVPGFVTLGGLAQGDGATDRLFGYELAAGGGGGGAAGEIGYNVYRDGMLIAYVESPTTEYYDLYLNPAEYCYTVTAVYDLEPFGFAPGTTDESLEEGPACVNVQYGAPIPWMEDWNSTNFSYNNWMFEPAQGHWRISNAMGNDVPSAEFNWAAPEADYSYAMVSQALDASIFDCSVIKLDFDLKLDDRNQTGAEMLTVDVYWDGMWHKVAEYKNEGSFDWETKSIDISTVAKKAFKVRFVAHGDNTADIIAWFVDNVNAYPVPNAASNLTGTQAVGPDAVATLTWNAPECATGPVGDLLKLSQHDGNPANGYYQSYGMAYGVVYDLTAYPDATLAKIDFHHASWGVTGVWQYNIHVVDWTTYAEIASIGPLVTTGNDIWENNIMLGDIMGYGGGQVGIMLEPLSNNPTDAYPDFSADNVGPDGVSMFGTLPDFSGFGASGIGDFLQNLWIYTAFGDGKVMVAPKVQVSQLQQQATARVATGAVMNRAFLTLNQKAINYTPTEGGNRGVVGYNVYRRYSTETEWTLLNATPLTDTTYTDNLPEFGEFCYVVKAVHAAFNNSTIESPESNEHCGWMMVGQQELNAQSISVYPNPATDKLTVKTTSEITRVELVNYLGQVVRNQQVSGSGVYTLNVSELESGVYFVKFYAADGQAGMERVTITR